jgi:hypothetical protein
MCTLSWISFKNLKTNTRCTIVQHKDASCFGIYGSSKLGTNPL